MPSRTDKPGRIQDLIYGAALLAAAVLFYLAPWPVGWVPALVALAALTWLRLDLALLLVPLFLPYFMVPKHAGRWEFSPAEVLIVLDVVVAAGRFGIDRPDLSRLYRSPPFAPAVVFVAGATISTVLAAQVHVALEWYRWTVVEPILYAAVCLLWLRDQTQWRRLLLSVVAGAVAVSFLGIGQYLTGQDLSRAGALLRVEGPYGSPDNLGLLLDRAIPIWLGMVTVAPRVPRLILATCGVPLLVALALTYSRGAWVAVALAALLILGLGFPWGRWLVVAAAVIVIGGVVLKGPSLLHSLQAGHAGTVQRRVDIWTSAVHMVRDHPLVGIGPDNFQHYYAPPHQPYTPCQGLGYMNPRDWPEPCLSHPHDEILDAWLSTGLLGLLALVWLQVVFWVQSTRLWFKLRNGAVLGVMGAMLAALVHGLVDNSYFLPDLAVIFWILAGTVVAWRYD